MLLTHVTYTFRQGKICQGHYLISLTVNFLNEYLERNLECEVNQLPTETLHSTFGDSVKSMWDGLKWPSKNYQMLSEFVNTMALSESSTQQLLHLVSNSRI